MLWMLKWQRKYNGASMTAKSANLMILMMKLEILMRFSSFIGPGTPHIAVHFLMQGSHVIATQSSPCRRTSIYSARC